MAKGNNQKPPDNPTPETGDLEQPEQIKDPIFISLTKEDLAQIIREARHDPRVEAQLEAEARRVESRRKQMVMIAKQDEKARIMRQRSCRHRKPNGEETSGGQEHSDGYIQIICLRCQKVLRRYLSPDIARAMAIRDKMAAMGMTDADIREKMDFQGEGDPSQDPAARGHDDFVLGAPKGGFDPDLTTETIGNM